MLNSYAAAFILLLLALLTPLIVKLRRREAILSKPQPFHGNNGHAGAATESVLTEKYGSNQTSPSYEDVFPPHRRLALAEIGERRMDRNGASAKELSRLPPDYSKLTPDKAANDTDDLLSHTTPTGFTVEEIKRLGDFPDYAALSGIPLPNEYTNFNIASALPRPYRPFRWPYHQTMSLNKIEPEFWLELEHTYVERIKQRQELYAQFGPEVLQALPGSELATKELMEVCLDFLCARYPKQFTLDKANMMFHNHLLETHTNLKNTEPLHVLLNNVPEDFAIMIRNPETGIYSFRGGMIMSAQGWSLGTKIGLKVHEIHAPVPDYKSKMQFSMDRFFAKMPTDKGIQRGSWSLEIGKPLFQPPGDPYEALKERQDPNLSVDHIHLRVDWQTLRRLPLSGAAVFNFKAVFTPFVEFRHEPYIPSLLLKVLREGNKKILEYKGTWHIEHVVIPALEQYETEQVEMGMVERDWEPKTLEEAPFYPDWTEMWRKKQGF